MNPMYCYQHQSCKVSKPKPKVSKPKPKVAVYSSIISPKATKQYGLMELTHKSGHPIYWNSDVDDNLYGIANYKVKGTKKSVAMYHGTDADSARLIQNEINWNRGTGRMDKGFYLTFIPYEAIFFGCDRTGKLGKDRVALLEYEVQNADTILSNESWESAPKNKGFVQSPYVNSHINMRDDVDKLILRSIHYMDISDINLYYSHGEKTCLSHIDVHIKK